MLLTAYMQIFGYFPLNIHCTAILLDEINERYSQVPLVILQHECWCLWHTFIEHELETLLILAI